jgi:hypothetical protein
MFRRASLSHNDKVEFVKSNVPGSAPKLFVTASKKGQKWPKIASVGNVFIPATLKNRFSPVAELFETATAFTVSDGWPVITLARRICRSGGILTQSIFSQTVNHFFRHYLTARPCCLTSHQRRRCDLEKLQDQRGVIKMCCDAFDRLIHFYHVGRIFYPGVVLWHLNLTG